MKKWVAYLHKHFTKSCKWLTCIWKYQNHIVINELKLIKRYVFIRRANIKKTNHTKSNVHSSNICIAAKTWSKQVTDFYVAVNSIELLI